MKNSIDELIKNSIEPDNLPSGHTDRFLEKLQTINSKRLRTERRKRRLRWITATSTAAIMIFSLLIFSPEPTKSSEIACDEVCEFLKYTDNNILQLENEILTSAYKRLSPSEFQSLKSDLQEMLKDYERSKYRDENMNEDEFLGIMYSVYEQQTESLNNIVAVLN